MSQSQRVIVALSAALTLSAGCTSASPDFDAAPPADLDAATVDTPPPPPDSPQIPIGDSGKPLWDLPRPPDLPKGKDLPLVKDTKVPSKEGLTKDKAVTPKDTTVPKDTFVPPTDLPPGGAIKVAAVQYGPDLYGFAPGCSNDLCGVSYFITQAKNNGATHVVIPEGALPQQYAELSPNIGDKPALYSSSPLMKSMATLADNLNITLVFQMITQEGTGTTAKLYNTEIAIDGTGTVVARHYKYYLYGEPGISLGTNCCDPFTTPAGQAGMLICADINCIVDLKAVGNCTSNALNLMNTYAGKKYYITFFSSYWMTTGSLDPAWQANQVQSKFATYASTYMVAANIIDGTYHGGGVYRPDGTPISIVNMTTPGIAYGVIPKQGTAVPPPPPPTAKIVITEIMMNPSIVADADGEWIELYNAGTSTVDLTGWSVRDGTPGMADWLSTYSLAPGQYAVVGVNTNKATNGGAAVVSAWNSFGLGNTSGTVQLYNAAGVLADQVVYGTGWPKPTGASISLKSVTLDNSLPANWCTETTAWPGSAGDKGTPGAPAGC